MIKFIVARHDNDIYSKYLEKSINKIDCVVYEVMDSEGESLSITEKYNIGIDNLINDTKYENKDDDIIVFSHEDVSIVDEYFQEKINMVFKIDTKIGLC
jgi:hypothetical protein